MLKHSSLKELHFHLDPGCGKGLLSPYIQLLRQKEQILVCSRKQGQESLT